MFKRLAQVVALIGCGIAVAAGAMIEVDYAQSHWVPDAIWVQLTGFTALTFISVALRFRHRWQRPSFWSVLSLLLLVHTVVYALVLLRVPSWRIPWFMGVALLEIPALVYLVSVIPSFEHPGVPRI